MTRLRVKVVPGASRTEIAGWLGVELKVRVAAPPEGGRANQAVIETMAGALQIPSGQVRIVAGAGSSRKTLEIDGIPASEVKARLS